MSSWWTYRLQGGAFDGLEVEGVEDPQPVLVAWDCGDPDCVAHATFDPENPNIVLATAESYRRGDVDVNERVAVYELGDLDPSRDESVEDELALTGMTYGMPALRDFLARYEQTAEMWRKYLRESGDV